MIPLSDYEKFNTALWPTNPVHVNNGMGWTQTINLPPVTVTTCKGCGAVVFDKTLHTEESCWGLSRILEAKGGTP